MNLYEECTYSTKYPSWVVRDFQQEACVLSERIVSAEMGNDWDWQGLGLDDFDNPHYKIIFRACQWLESIGEPCAHTNVRTIAILIADSEGLECIRGSLNHLHSTALAMDKLWSQLTLDKYDHILALKGLTLRRTIINESIGAIEAVTHFESADWNIGNLAHMESLKSRKQRAYGK